MVRSACRVIRFWAVQRFGGGSMLNVAYQAQEQVNGPPESERLDLVRVLSEGEDPTHIGRASGSDRFVSRFGANRRALWERSASGDVTVLSVVTKS